MESFPNSLSKQNILGFYSQFSLKIKNFRNIFPKLQGEKQNDSMHWLSGLSKAVIIYEADRYNIKGWQYLTTLPKYYLVDLGLRWLLENEDF